MQLLSALLSEGSIVDLDATFFIQFAVFFVAFGILNALVFQPMLKLFEAREQRIDGAKLEAKQLEREAKDKGKELEAEMSRMRAQAAEERDRIRADGKRLENEVLSKVRNDTATELAKATADLDHEAKKLRDQLDAQTSTLAKQIASKLLQREVR